MKREEVNHHFFTRLGKIRLRPGGKLATDWLIANGDFRKDKQVLEIACHTASTSIEIANQFGCKVTAIDADEEIVEKAIQNVKENKLEEYVQVQCVKTVALPFADNSFDIVLNEAMLSMLPLVEKEQAIQEYFRILKPNGFLLTHDVMLNTDEAEEIITQLQTATQSTLTPLTKNGWKNLFQQVGFRNVETFNGEIRLLSPKGLIDDEGVLGAMKVVGNALKSENRDTVKKVIQTFNQVNSQLGFITTCSQK